MNTHLRLFSRLNRGARLLAAAALVALLVGASGAFAQVGAPDAPNQPTGSAVFIGGVDLEWNEVSGADAYDVQLYRDGWIDLPGDGVAIAYYGAGAIISGLNHKGSSYWFQVRAKNSHGFSDWSGVSQMGSTSEYSSGRRIRPENVPATGAPVFTGVAQVGETLTVNTTDIVDGNGLERVKFRFQWVSGDGSGDTDIAGATDESYVLAASEEGKTVKARVSFTDRGGYAETLTGAGTEPVVPSAQATPNSTSEPTPDSTVEPTPTSTPEPTPEPTVEPTPEPAPEPAQNSPATGAPIIVGTAQVGETLTADTSGITDANGLSDATFGYQWIASDGTTDTDITGAANATYTLVAADEGKTVKVRVSFTDDADNEETLTGAATAAVSAAVVVAEPQEPPAQPTGLTATAAHDSVSLSWDDPADDSVTGYQILRRDRAVHATGDFQVIVDDTGSADASYTDDTVEAERIYVYRVKARNAAGLSELSDYFRADIPATPGTQPPAQPTGLTATAAHDSVSLSWDDPADDSVTGYQILRRDRAVHATGDFQVIVDDTGSAGASYTDDTVEVEKIYVYRIKARNAAGLSELSDYFRADIPATPGTQPPAQPTGLTATAAHDSVSLSWDDPADDSVTGYQILRRDRAVHATGDFQVIVDDTGSADASYTDDTVEAERIYVYRVKARNAAGLSELSDYFRADIPSAPQPPSSDAGLSALTLSDVALSPVFDTATELYSGSYLGAGTQITVDATANESAALVEVAPQDADTAADHQVALSDAGETVIEIRVLAPDAETERSYWVVVGRASVSDEASASLNGLQLTGLPPLAFDEAQSHYELEVPADVSETTVVASRAETDSTVEVIVARGGGGKLEVDDADADVNSAGHQALLSDSGDTLVIARVTSSDGKLQGVYVVRARRGAGGQSALRSDDAPTLSVLSLSGVSISPVFASDTLEYTAEVGVDVSEVTVSATATDSDATPLIIPSDADTVAADHQVALGAAGTETTIAVLVANSDSSLNSYIITVTREAPVTPTTLKSLSVSGHALSPAFASDTYLYAVSAAAAVSEVTVEAEATSSSATIQILPADADPVEPGWQIALGAPGTLTTTSVAFIVRATGVTIHSTYQITVTRAAPDPTDASLQSLGIGGDDLTPVFATDTYDYALTVEPRRDSVTLEAVTGSLTASVAVTPEDADLNLSGYQIPLEPVEVDSEPSVTTISVEVTSEDGNTTQTYTIAVTRLAQPAVTLPVGCALEELDGSGGRFTKSDNWRPSCRSILEYRENAGRPERTGYTHFYRIDVEEYSNVSIRLTDYNTSHHYLLRSADLTEIRHIFHHVEYPSGGSCPQFGYPCSPVSRLRTALHPGEYVLELIQHYSFDGRQTSYELEVLVDAIPGVTVEPEDDFAADTSTTATLDVEGAGVGVIAVNWDRDWFAVDLVADAEYDIHLRGWDTSHGTLTDPHLYGIHDSAGTLIADTADADGGKERNSRTRFTAPYTGAYYVSAGASGGLTGSYELAVEYADDYTDDADTTGVVPVNGSATGEIAPAREVDWLAVDLVPGRTYRFDVEGLDSGQGTLPDPVLLGVYTSDGARVKGSSANDHGSSANDNGGTGRDSRRSLRITNADARYIAVGGKYTGKGTYRVTVTQTSGDIAANTGTAADVYDHSHHNREDGAIDWAGDVDWFETYLIVWKKYRVTVSGVDSSLGKLQDPKIIGIYNEHGNVIRLPHSDNVVLQPGEHYGFTYIAVGDGNGGTGAYRIKIKSFW